MTQKKQKAVLFDIGSTLVNGPELSPAKAIWKILQNPDIDSAQISRILMREDFDGPAKACHRLRMSGYVLNSYHEEQITALWQRQQSEARQIDGATEAVMALKAMGYKIGLISDIWAPYYLSFERACPEIAALTDSFILSFREGIKKPSPALFHRALAAINTRATDTVMVGDTYSNDIEPAIALGLRTVWVLFRPDRELEALVQVINGKKPKPDFTISHIQQLTDLPIWEEGA
ncbi:MAG TPA: HAD family hydrolase [Thermodesulfovibrionia bacterium]|nr:HAD family hydrolase [Thermodesulfovibrionia bacterium]